MPIYVYKCEDCLHEDEMARHISERDKAPLCRKCGGGNTKRLYVFTGLAWSPTSGGYSGQKKS
jgi:putative FmdB family regulatory protein